MPKTRTPGVGDAHGESETMKSFKRADRRHKLIGLGLVAAMAVTLTALSPQRAWAQDEDENMTSEEAHMPLFEDKDGKPYYPSASECKQCHPDHYREWSVSPHAYAQMSPVFNAMHAKILKLTNGTNGDFCIRCHTPVGMNLGEDIFMSNIDRHPTSREGVTCIVCHRVSETYGKISGRVFLEAGTIDEPIYGPKGDPDFSETFGAEISEKFGEDKVHEEAKQFFQLNQSGFCGTCHDVNLLNGFRLEEAFSEFKRSPAAEKGVTCSDCHMGVLPGACTGDPETNYDKKQIAKIGFKWVGEERKKTNHMFAGPDHSVIHAGIFPHNDGAAEFATIREWLTYDYPSGWGTPDFEEEEEPARIDAGQGTAFPDRWTNIDERYEARDILYEQFELLEEYHEERIKVLQAGYGLGDVIVERADPKKLSFDVEVKNLTDGHQVPTGFIAERVVYVQVDVKDPEGNVIYQSGDLDPNFDVRDLHSLYVHNRELPLDRDLFSLQSSFITRMNRGGEREQVLAINFSPSPLPFLRPSRFAATLTGNPAGARIHKKNIPPLGTRIASYTVPKKAMAGPGKYTATIKLISGMVPINLIDEIKDVGFDYGMSAWEVALGVRFGAGDVEHWETGERYTRNEVERMIEEEGVESVKDLYGVAGGHSILQVKKVDFEVGGDSSSYDERVAQKTARR